jgi:hypothetical protein
LKDPTRTPKSCGRKSGWSSSVSSSILT